MTNLKNKIQNSVDSWLVHIKDLTAERIECDKNETEFKYARALAEYKGRIYAIRQIAEMIGIELNTDFNGFAE